MAPEQFQDVVTYLFTVAPRMNTFKLLRFVKITIAFHTLFCSFVAGVVHPWKVPSFERLLWRACRRYIIVDFWEMDERLEVADTVRESHNPYKMMNMIRLAFCPVIALQSHTKQQGFSSLLIPQGEMVQWTVFLISYWGDQIGQKVKKICDWWVC